MIYAQPGTTIIEFPMHPHVNRCYGYMAMALGFDYWLVPSIVARYYGKFAMTKEKADLVTQTLRHVIRTRQLTWLLREDL